MESTRISLIHRVRNPADNESWREFMALYRPLLWSYVRSKGLQEHDANDVVQNILMRLHKALPEFELDRRIGRFRTWLWQVTSSVIVDWSRKEKRQPKAQGGNEETPLETIAKEEEPEDWRAAVRKRVFEFVMARISTQTQLRTWQCFEEHLVKGRPAAEVAAELGMTANSVYVYACRVLKKVREQCLEYEEELTDA